MDAWIAAALALRRAALAAAARLAWLPPTLARLAVGWIFLWSGWGKLHDLDAVIAFFGELGIPHPELQAPFAAATELVCGVLLLVGLATRLACVPLIVTMAVAIATAQWPQVESLAGFLGLVESLYVVLLAWLALAGPGPLALDAALLRATTARAPGTAGPGVAVPTVRRGFAA